MILTGHPHGAARSSRTRRTVLGALALGLLFETTNLVGTQDKAVYAHVPWHDDPFHAAVLAGVFTVAMLLAAIAARMLVWTAPGAADRQWQMARAAGVLTAVVALAAGFQWVSVAAHARGGAWNRSTAVQIVALAVTSAGALALGVGLARLPTARRSGASAEHDWLGDAALLLAWVPGLERAGAPAVVAWVRRRAVLVFATLSLLAAAPIAAAQAVGEGLTDPVIVGWFLGVLAATLFAFCMIANAFAGFVARPPRSGTRRLAERALVAGCLGIQLSEAFHDQLWRSLTGHPIGSAGALLALTGGAGLLAAAICAAVLALRRPSVPEVAA